MAARAVIPGSGVVAGEFDVSGLVLAYPHRLGGHCGSGAQRDLLAWAGLGWNGPPSEGLTFTLSGALDFSYLRSSELRPPLYLVGRGSDLETDLPTRLGATVDARSTDDPELGWKWVTNEIDSGRPVMAWADIAELPYLRVKLRMSRHDIVVIGYDDDAEIAHVVDNDREQTQLVPYAALARARASTSFPVPTRHTTFLIEWPEGLPPLRNVAADAFRQIASTMADPVVSRGGTAGATTGLQGVRAFAEDLDRWRAAFSPGALDEILRYLAAFIEKAGTGGGLFRRLLAEGCFEIAAAVGSPQVLLAAGKARTCAELWTAIATEAMRSDLDPAERLHAIRGIAHSLVDEEANLRRAIEVAATALDRPSTFRGGPQ